MLFEGSFPRRLSRVCTINGMHTSHARRTLVCARDDVNLNYKTIWERKMLSSKFFFLADIKTYFTLVFFPFHLESQKVPFQSMQTTWPLTRAINRLTKFWAHVFQLWFKRKKGSFCQTSARLSYSTVCSRTNFLRNFLKVHKFYPQPESLLFALNSIHCCQKNAKSDSFFGGNDCTITSFAEKKSCPIWHWKEITNFHYSYSKMLHFPPKKVNFPFISRKI